MGVGLGLCVCGGWHPRSGWQIGRGRGCMLTCWIFFLKRVGRVICCELCCE